MHNRSKRANSWQKDEEAKTKKICSLSNTKRAMGACIFYYLSKTSQIISDLHPGFFHMEDEKGNKLHLFKKYFKMMFFTIQVIIDPFLFILIALCVTKAFATKKIK